MIRDDNCNTFNYNVVVIQYIFRYNRYKQNQLRRYFTMEDNKRVESTDKAFEMKADEQAKPRSFRVTDSTFKAFKEVSKEIDGNQEEVLAQLIQCFEAQKAKEILKDKKDIIEKFERYTSTLVSMFMDLLQENQEIEETVFTRYKSFLQSKDESIKNYQDEVKALQGTIANAEKSLKELEQENRQLKESIDGLNKSLQDKEKIIADKDKLVANAEQNLQEEKDKIEKLLSDLVKMREEQRKIEELRGKITEQEKTIKQLEDNMKELNLNHREEILNIEKRLNDEKNQVILEYQSQYAVALQQLQMSKSEEMKDNTTVSDTE